MLFLPPLPPLQLRVGETVTIGRSRSCDLSLRSPDASRRHAEILLAASGWLVRDLDSTNGTFVNGKRVDRGRIQSGDLLQVGRLSLTVQKVKAEG